jgi:hypothetical protein
MFKDHNPPYQITTARTVIRFRESRDAEKMQAPIMLREDYTASDLPSFPIQAFDAL